MCTAVIPPLGGAKRVRSIKAAWGHSLLEVNLGYRRPCPIKELMRVRERGREEQKEEGGRDRQREGGMADERTEAWFF